MGGMKSIWGDYFIKLIDDCINEWEECVAEGGKVMMKKKLRLHNFKNWMNNFIGIKGELWLKTGEGNKREEGEERIKSWTNS